MRLADRPYNLPGFNFEKAEVREYVSRVVRDLVENYDYDGFQMEWNRTPLCCEPDASQETADMMTDWHAEVRAVTKAKAKATGKEYTVGMKYVGSWDQLRSIGLDVRTMVDRGLLDFVAPSNFWQSSWDIACDELREAVGPDVAVYGSIEFSPNYLHGYFPGQKQGNTSLGKELPVCYRLTPLCPPLLRGNAAAKLVLGVDGLEIYNYPCADSPSHWPWTDEPGCADYAALRGSDDLAGLRGQEKAYTLSTQTGYYIVPPWDTVAHFPGVLGPGEARLCRLPMCAEPEDGDLEFVIQVVVGKTEDAGVVAIMLNGSWPRVDGVLDDRLLFAVSTMTHHTPDHVGVNFVFPVSVIREGWNEIVVMHGTAKDHWAEQVGAEVSV
ncbi:MAG: hypothetical protein CMJ84_15920, partial [Planctomycetes bacterium]|nr:hypothetical protein [Planctomycetota bacterium]